MKRKMSDFELYHMLGSMEYKKSHRLAWFLHAKFPWKDDQQRFLCMQRKLTWEREMAEPAEN